MAEETKQRKSINDDVAALKDIKVSDFLTEDEMKAFIKAMKRYEDLKPETGLKLLANKLVTGEVVFTKSWS